MYRTQDCQRQILPCENSAAENLNEQTCIKNILIRESSITKAAIRSKIKHAIKLKTSPARLAQLLQPSLAFWFSLLQAKTKC